MEKKRRQLRGKPLLVASAGLVLTVGGCPGGGGAPEPPRGNLMPPPMVELCVTAEPPEAKVQVNGQELPAAGCAQVYQGTVEITASADGYQPLKEQLSVSAATRHAVKLSKGDAPKP